MMSATGNHSDHDPAKGKGVLRPLAVGTVFLSINSVFCVLKRLAQLLPQSIRTELNEMRAGVH